MTLSVYRVQPISQTGTTGTTQTGTDQTFTVSPVAQIFYGNQVSTITAFKAGDPVFITLDQDSEAAVIVDTAATQVRTQAGTVTGTVYQLSPSSITIAAAGGQDQEQGQEGDLGPGSYPLSSSVGVVVGGMSGNLSNVQSGDLVRLVVDASGQVTLIIVKAEAASISGTVLKVQRNWLFVDTTSGFVRVLATGATEITRNGQSATVMDIQAGDQVQAQGTEGEGGMAAATITATGSTTSLPLKPVPQSGNGH